MDPESIYLNEIRNFSGWLKLKNISDGYKHVILQYYKNYKLTGTKEFMKYLYSIDGSYRYCVLSLRAYLNFLIETGTVEQEVLVPYLRILRNVKKSQPDNYIPSDEEVKKAYGNIENARVKLYYTILAYSGIHITELYKLFSEFDSERLIVGEKFAKYPLKYFRGQKKVFYVYLPIELANQLTRHYKTNSKAMTKQLTRSGLNPKYLRKWFYNFLIYSNVPESIADYIEGRTTQTVGSMRYLGKTKQADFWYSKVIEELVKVLN